MNNQDIHSTQLTTACIPGGQTKPVWPPVAPAPRRPGAPTAPLRPVIYIIVLCLSLLLNLPFPTPVQAQSPLDQIGWLSPDTKGTQSVAWGDMDGDGDLDLAVGNQRVNQVYENDGQGNFTPLDLSTDTKRTSSVAWGDMDGDGDLDLAVGNYRDVNQVYENDGQGGFALHNLGTDTKNTLSVAWGDMDGDGDLDLAVGNGGVYPGGEINQVYENDGQGDFTPLDLGTDTKYTTSVAWGDMDGDGDLDLAVGNYRDVNQVYENDGQGSFTPFDLGTDTKGTSSVAWGDMDGDGDLDLAVGNYDFESNQVYENDGQGGFTPLDLGKDTKRTQSVAWGDMDGDGDLDLAVGNDEDAVNQVYENDGQGGFALHNLDTDTKKTFGVAWGDMDGDGNLDLAVGNYGDVNQVYENDGQGGFALHNLDTDTKNTTSVAWGDMDGDGDLDLAVGNYGDPDWSVGNYGDVNQVYENDGQGGFTPLHLGSDTKATTSVAWGDMDGDGDLDLAVGNDFESNQVYENDGHGGFTPLDLSSNTIIGTTSVAWGDMDGDGDLDLAVGNYDYFNQVYRNDGQGGFSGSALHGPDITDPYDYSKNTQSVAWGDMDGDGDLDLAVGNYGDVNQVYENDGQGDFTPLDLGTDTKRTVNMAWGDMDGDGDLDLAVGNYGGVNQVYENDGLGGFTLFNLDSSTMIGISSMAWGDMDGDGDLDLAVGNDGGQVNQVYENDGHGEFTLHNLGTDTKNTQSVAWGDMDGDGDLDLAAGNYGDVNQVYENDGHGGLTRYDLGSGIKNTQSVAWGDMGGDGDLDLAVGNYGDVNQVYENDGQGGFTPLHLGNDIRNTYSVAWGDMDGDGDLDLAVGNSGDVNQVYENDGQDGFTPHDLGTDTKDTKSVAWGDMDGDGDLDLAVGNSGDVNQVYENDGQGGFTPLHLGSDIRNTYSVAWGDMDGDGDLDLAAGNSGDVNQVYENDGHGGFTPLDLSTDTKRTSSVAWGDMDGDGDLDLAVGNSGDVNQVYENNGQGGFTPFDLSTATERTLSVTWGDMNGDGDLDLAAGNYFGSNQVYENDGQGGFIPLHLGSDTKDTNSLAWGDMDGDGDVDLAVGNSFGGSNQVYENGHWKGEPLVDNAPNLTLTRPISPAVTSFYVPPQLVAAPTIPLTYTLFDPEGDPVRFIRAYYSPNGGGQWLPATPAPCTAITNLSTSAWPTGATHTFIWQADADLIKSDNVVFRIEAYQGFTGPGPYQRPYASATTFPFRVQAAQWYGKVVSGTQPISGALVYQAGQLITGLANNAYRTDRAGLIRLNTPSAGDPLVALLQTHEQPTIRAAHNGWAYRTYVTSLDLDDQGAPQPDTIDQPGEQLITIRPDDPLILFNIVASVEWDADLAYLQTISRAFQLASDYLYDVTDGQMAFGQVAIYDNAVNWADADFQFSTKNTVRPYAFVGGITSADEAHTIRVGRFWSGDSGNQGGWDQPAGYRTLIHEFGHYALYLHDEYKHLRFENGRFVTEENGSCTSPLVRINNSDETNGSLMYYQYNASELVDSSRWNSNCQKTEQHRRNGEADWQTVRRYYGGPGWQLRTADERPGGVMAGPDGFPRHLLPFPDISVKNGGTPGGAARQLTVVNPQGQQVHNALVALYTTPQSYTIAIDQGLTGSTGVITIYGARNGDTIRAATFDGALAGALAVNDQSSYTMTVATTSLSSLQAQAGLVPYLNLIPDSDGDSLTLRLNQLPADGPPLNAAVLSGQSNTIQRSTLLSYSPGSNTYAGTVNFAPVGLGTGTGRVQIWGPGLPGGYINSDYNLQVVSAMTTSHLFSEDGNFELYIPPGGVPASGYATVVPTGYVPERPPARKQVIGSAYEVRLSGAVSGLDKTGLVRLHYHPEVMGVYTNTEIYYWDASAGQWQGQGGEPNEVDQGLAVSTDRLGIYALMGVPLDGSGSDRVYLPLIVK